MPAPLEHADWILQIGLRRKKVGVSQTFVTKFAACSAKIRKLVRDPRISRSRTLPLPDLNHFTLVHENYIVDDVYDYSDNPRYFAGPFLAGREPRAGYEQDLAFERCWINCFMYEFATIYGIEDLEEKALAKFRVACRTSGGPYCHPKLARLIVQCDEPLKKGISEALRSEGRLRLKDGSLPREKFESMESAFAAKRARLEQVKPVDWEDDAQLLLEFVLFVEHGAGTRRLLRGDPFY